MIFIDLSKVLLTYKGAHLLINKNEEENLNVVGLLYKLKISKAIYNWLFNLYSVSNFF